MTDQALPPQVRWQADAHNPPDLPIDATTDVDILTANFPEDQVRWRDGAAGRKFAYYPAHLIIERLNAATDHCWSFQVLGIFAIGNTLVTHGRLTLPLLGSREHIGIGEVNPKGGADLLKGSVTDCLKKCATLFGVADELYEDDAPQPPQAARPSYGGGGSSYQARPAQARPAPTGGGSAQPENSRPKASVPDCSCPGREWHFNNNPTCPGNQG